MAKRLRDDDGPQRLTEGVVSAIVARWRRTLSCILAEGLGLAVADGAALLANREYRAATYAYGYADNDPFGRAPGDCPVPPNAAADPGVVE